MVYAKIFLNPDGMLVFEAVNEYIKFRVYPNHEYVDENGETKYGSKSILITTVENMAISPEAKAVIREKFHFRNKNFDCDFFGDFCLIPLRYPRDGEHGSFSFVPEEGKNSRTLDPNGVIKIDRTYGFSLSLFDYMQVFDNDFLTNLDLTEPYDPNAA